MTFMSPEIFNERNDKEIKQILSLNYFYFQNQIQLNAMSRKNIYL